MSQNVSIYAGKPANVEVLVDIPKLITSYYTSLPDTSVAKQHILFGTSGHRGSSFERTFNEWHILAITQAICLFRQQQQIKGPLFLGIDTHALSIPAFTSALEVLVANNVEVMIAKDDEYTPTPAISHAILTYNRGRTMGFADGIIITPSHNSPSNGGFKYNPPTGGPANHQITSWIENKANELLKNKLHGVKRIPFEKAIHSAAVHHYDYLNDYINDLSSVIDMDAIRSADIHLGVDPFGGAGVNYWNSLAERYGLNVTVINKVVDPTFRFMNVDWDGQIRMDPSSPYTMVKLVELKDQFDIAFACDTDHDRHGIVTKGGLMPPNDYLCAAISYLFQHRPQWTQSKSIGKTVVCSQMIDRIAAKLGHNVYEVPVGFKWFVEGLFQGALAFCGEESAGATFNRLDGSLWTTDKDGIVPALLSAEMTACLNQDLKEYYNKLENEFGKTFYERRDIKTTSQENKMLKELTPEQLSGGYLAGEKIEKILTHAPGNGAKIGGLKVMTAGGWFVARPSETESIFKIYAESFYSSTHLNNILEEAQFIISNTLNSTHAVVS